MTDLYEGLYTHNQGLLIFILAFLSLLTYSVCLQCGRMARVGGKASVSGPFFNYFLLEIPIFILPGLVIISSGMLDGYWFIANSTPKEYELGFYIGIFTLLTFSLSLFVFSKLIPERVLKISVKRKVDVRALTLALQCLLILMIALNTYLAKDWPMLLGIIEGDLKIRRSDVGHNYEGVPYFISFMKLCAFCGAATFGYLWARSRAKMRALLLLFLSLLAASWTGAKGPAVSVLLFSIFSFIFFSEKKLSLIKTSVIAVLAFSFAYAIYYLAMYQRYGDAVSEFFLIRVFAGQIGGLYEALAVGIQDFKYLYHGLPFGGRFTDLNPYYRDLMVASEGASLTSGVKNSLFSAEAYGIGGAIFSLFSGIVFAAAVIISCRLLVLMFSAVVEKQIIPIFLFPLVNNFPLTGEFASVALFGKFCIGFFYLFVVIFFCYLLSAFNVRSKKRLVDYSSID